MTDAPTTEATGESAETNTESKQQENLLPQSEVDKIVRERVARERAKYADYDELKTKAEGSKTLEERLASLETELTSTRAEALKTRIAAKFGISTEPGADGGPSDADLFLTGTDESTLTAQAQRLAAREADRKKNGNVAPNEGDTKQNGNAATSDLREFTRNLFASGDD